MRNVWVVRAGVDNRAVEDVKHHGVIAYGGPELGDLRKLQTKKAILEKQEATSVGEKIGAIRNWAVQHWKVLHEIQKGDIVLTPVKQTREVMIGLVTGDYEFAPEINARHPHVRRVDWRRTVSRDEFSQSARNSLGSTLAVFSLNAYHEEVEALLEGGRPKPEAEAEEEIEASVDLYSETKQKAEEAISDRLSRIGPYDFQELVAAVLRAMGMRTKVSPPGPDQGVDIVAHPDALGFGSPRVKVQVKHRKGSTGGPDMRNFLSTLTDTEKGLFVSTGGFTSEAREEPLRRGKNVALLDQDEFTELLLEHYEKIDPTFQAMIPLRKVYILVEPE